MEIDKKIILKSIKYLIWKVLKFVFKTTFYKKTPSPVIAN